MPTALAIEGGPKIAVLLGQHRSLYSFCGEETQLQSVPVGRYDNCLMICAIAVATLSADSATWRKSLRLAWEVRLLRKIVLISTVRNLASDLSILCVAWWGELWLIKAIDR